MYHEHLPVSQTKFFMNICTVIIYSKFHLVGLKLMEEVLGTNFNQQIDRLKTPENSLIY